MNSVSGQEIRGGNAREAKAALPRRIGAVLSDIKIAHTVFALPFALASAHLAFLATGGYRINTLVAILVCMVTARTAAMSFNRYLDRDLDSLNPRTVHRSIPSGRARPVDALAVVITCSILFIAACWYLGPWLLILSIPTLAFILAYSIIKRYSVLTHVWLGAALAIAPMGAWIAITNGWSWLPATLSFAVVCWVAGFDVIYALQDVEFDKAHKVFSIPARFGIAPAIWTSRGLHVMSFLALAAFGSLARIGWPYWAVLGLIFVVLVTEHLLVRQDDLSRVGVAFFTMNGIISILLYIGVLAATLPVAHISGSGVAF